MAKEKKLIQIANEKFGELKNGDLLRFDWAKIGVEGLKTVYPIKNFEWGWHYKKNTDALFLGYSIVYKKGVWAERVDKPKNVKASYGAIYQKEGEMVLYMQFNLNTNLPVNHEGLGELIIAKIEELNKDHE